MHSEQSKNMKAVKWQECLEFGKIISCDDTLRSRLQRGYILEDADLWLQAYRRCKSAIAYLLCDV